MKKYIIALSVLCLSCQEKSDTSENDKLLVEIQVEAGLKNKVDRLLLSDVAADVDIIPLETSKESVIGYVFNMACGEENLVFNELHRVTLFDKVDGKFKGAIGDLGTGPTDYYYCGGVGVDELRKYVHLFSSPDVKTYDFEGKFVKSVKVALPGASMWAEANPGRDTRTYLYLNGKHVFRRMLPVFDGSKNIWQLGMADTTGRYFAKYSEPSCLDYQEGLNKHNSGGKGFELEEVQYMWGASSPVLNRYYNHVNCLFDSNDTIYRYSEKENTLKPRYILQCGGRPSFQEMHQMGKPWSFFDYTFVVDVLEGKDFLYLVAEKERSSYLLRVDKKDGSIRAIENVGVLEESQLMKVKQRKVTVPEFTNDLCGGLPFFPRSQTDRQWIALYEASDLLEQINPEELKKSEVLLPDKRDRLVQILQNLKEDDNPVVMIVTLKK